MNDGRKLKRVRMQRRTFLIPQDYNCNRIYHNKQYIPYSNPSQRTTICSQRRGRSGHGRRGGAGDDLTSQGSGLCEENEVPDACCNAHKRDHADGHTRSYTGAEAGVSATRSPATRGTARILKRVLIVVGVFQAVGGIRFSPSGRAGAVGVGGRVRNEFRGT